MREGVFFECNMLPGSVLGKAHSSSFFASATGEPKKRRAAPSQARRW
jgi:hypothetical protein